MLQCLTQAQNGKFLFGVWFKVLRLGEKIEESVKTISFVAL
jgi:hypothetical protein